MQSEGSSGKRTREAHPFLLKVGKRGSLVTFKASNLGICAPPVGEGFIQGGGGKRFYDVFANKMLTLISCAVMLLDAVQPFLVCERINNSRWQVIFSTEVIGRGTQGDSRQSFERPNTNRVFNIPVFIISTSRAYFNKEFSCTIWSFEVNPPRDHKHIFSASPFHVIIGFTHGGEVWL